MQITGLSDRELFTRAFSAEENDPEADQEIDRRFGYGACDLLASYFTASHASTADTLRMANEQTDLLAEIARDQHRCTRREGIGSRCRCGAIVQ